MDFHFTNFILFPIKSSGQTASFGIFGTGADGDLAVGSGQTQYTDNTRSAASSTANTGQYNITLSSAGGFAVGKEVLIIQMQGTGVGNYEFGTITGINGNTLTLLEPLENTYTVGGNSKAQVLQVPHYQDVTVQSGGTLRAHSWDGNSGGVVVFRASGDVQVNGTLQINGSNGAVATGNPQGATGGGFRGELEIATLDNQTRAGLVKI